MNSLAYTLFGGFAMALADSVPGVSGGTIAFLLGFYERFVGALDAIVHGTWVEKKRALFYLLKLGLGWAAGMALAVTALASAFTTGIYKLSSLFLGFVIASLPLVAAEQRAVMGSLRRGVLPFVFGAALVVLLAALNLSSVANSSGAGVGMALYVFIAGALAITAMVLPGISGSSLLMSFGLYLPVIAALKDALALHFQRLWMLVSLALGIAAGLAVFPHMLKKLMENHASAVTYAVLGMMVGSLYAIIVGPATLKVPQHAMTLADFDALWLALGAALMLALSFLKSGLARRRETGAEGNGFSAGMDKKGLLR